MQNNKLLKVSLITPILKVDNSLKNLATSLNLQLNHAANWIVVGEKKIKKNFLSNIKRNNKNIIFKESDNKGIYAAINEALRLSSINQYYLILGQDDKIVNAKLFKEIVDQVNFDKNTDLNADIYQLNTVSQNKKELDKISKLKQNFSPVFSHHSGGMLIKTALHKKFGYYDENYKLASDYKFLKKIKKKIFIKKTDILSAKIGVHGSSAKKPLYGLYERLLIDIDNKGSYVKILILLKYFFKLTKQIIFNNKTK